MNDKHTEWKSSSAIWVVAILLPFATQFLFGLLPEVGEKILRIAPQAVGLFLYYFLIVSPSYALLLLVPRDKAGRLASLLAFTALLVAIVPLVMIMSVYVGCYVFNSCP